VDADDFDDRLDAAARRLAALGDRLLAGGPWPLAERIDHSPEAAWGPREVLAHLEEMLAYWQGEAERVLDMTAGPEPFGRVAADAVRLAVIERDRTLPIRELLSRIDAGIDRWRRRWAELDDDERERPGLHQTLGAMSAADIASKFVAGHLEDHLTQLEDSLADRAAPA
jgi:hypothetical protein